MLSNYSKIVVLCFFLLAWITLWTFKVNVEVQPNKQFDIATRPQYNLTRRDGDKATKTAFKFQQPCYKVVYTWLNKRDKFHVKLLFKQIGKFPCPGLHCGVQIEFGQNLTKLGDSDVVFLFYKHPWKWQDLLKYRSAGQKWIFWTTESPRHTAPCVIPLPEYSNRTYDYIMSFRKGAANKEAYLSEGGYGFFDRSKPSIQLDDRRNWAENKTKMVAWVVTNCYRRTLSYDRTGFVKALSKYVQVDKFGKCHNKPCKDLVTCGVQNYKFYLALENSECEDYITEKLWYNSLALGLIPIVFGAPKENYVKEAPPNSFIFVQDFKSIAKLAAYIIELSNNDDLYNRYFQWKKEGTAKYYLQYSNFKPESLCKNVIRRVLSDEEYDIKSARKGGRKPLVNDWHEWWTKSCKPTVSGFPIPEK